MPCEPIWDHSMSGRTTWPGAAPSLTAVPRALEWPLLTHRVVQSMVSGWIFHSTAMGPGLRHVLFCWWRRGAWNNGCKGGGLQVETIGSLAALHMGRCAGWWARSDGLGPNPSFCPSQEDVHRQPACVLKGPRAVCRCVSHPYMVSVGGSTSVM